MKILAIKNIVISTILISLVVSCSKEVEKTSLVERDGLMCKLNSTKGFSGIAITSHENGQREYECQYEMGMKEGLERYWFENGQLSAEYTYTEGVLDGSYLEWFKSGQPKLVASYARNELNGSYQSWHTPNQPSIKCSYVKGKLIGGYLSWWDGNFSRGQSKIIANYSIDGYRDGEYFSYYYNGQLEEHSFYKNGVVNGTYVYWTDKSTPFSENYLFEKGTFDMGKKVGNWEYLDTNGRAISVEEYIALGGRTHLFADLKKVK